jgi:hypothetical protein
MMRRATRLSTLRALALATTTLLWATAGGAAESNAVESPGAADVERLAEGATHLARAEVVVLHGTNSGKGIDPRIGNLPQLKQPPFSSYDSYELLAQKELPLASATPEEMVLPNQGKLRVTLKDVKQDDKGRRYFVDASISKPGGKKFLPVLQVNAKPGEIFFVAGQKYKKGVLVLGIRIHPPKAKKAP